MTLKVRSALSLDGGNPPIPCALWLEGADSTLQNWRNLVIHACVSVYLKCWLDAEHRSPCAQSALIPDFMDVQDKPCGACCLTVMMGTTGQSALSACSGNGGARWTWCDVRPSMLRHGALGCPPSWSLALRIRRLMRETRRTPRRA